MSVATSLPTSPLDLEYLNPLAFGGALTALDLCKKLDYEVKVLLCGSPLTVVGGGVFE